MPFVQSSPRDTVAADAAAVTATVGSTPSGLRLGADAMSESTLQKAFTEALGLSPDTDFTILAYRSVEEWDSIAHMILIAAIEDAFDIMLETQDVLDMSSYEEAKIILKRYGVELG
jgi:acyl carrier protein